MKLRKITSVICALGLAVSSMTIGAFAEEKEFVKTDIFTGESKISTGWTLGPEVQTTNGSGSFDPTEITKDGYFTVDYKGTEGAVYLAFSEWTTSKWASVNVPTSTESTSDGYTSMFSFDDCAAAYGSEDFSDVNAICAGTTTSVGETVITNISWHGYKMDSDLGETAMLYRGSKTANTVGTNLTFFYTKHVGGEWDASTINEGSYFYVEYTGAEDGIYLALASASGATNWAAVYADETGTTADGRRYSKFNYDNFSQAFGTNFARLDQIQAYCSKNEEVTLKRIAYFEGTGDPVDTSDGTWDRPDEGIAFIGDSIVQNPLVDSAHLNNIDWNGILGREDCVNYGIGGQTTKECSARIDELAKKNYDKVVMLCGINDIGRGFTNDEIIANYETMFAALKATNPDIEIFVISVLPTTPVFYTGAQDLIVALDADLKALTERNDNVTYVDCYSAFVGEDGYCKEGITFDGLHPNLDGYALIAEILNPYLESETPVI
ncbi:MAG: GDSL-type esterase/lipase family protein, partial [Ruminococcus sp.]|nr:GDSL-type esterase/lipase family protein [Ruminococcus sp.]